MSAAPPVFWQRVLQFALVLWIVRVAVIMTVLGWLLLALAPQAQDLFLEFARPIGTSETSKFVVALVHYLRMFVFVVVLTVLWAMTTHYAARLLLDTDARFQDAQRRSPWTSYARGVERWVPRVLGLLTFPAVWLAIGRSWTNLPILDEHEVTLAVKHTLIELAAFVGAAAAGFLVYTVWRPRAADVAILRALRRFNKRLLPIWRKLSPGLADAPGSEGEAGRDLGRLLLAGGFVVFVFIFVFGANFAAELFPRAMAVPFILGGWLPFLSYLSGLGRQWRAPLITGLFVVVSFLAVFLGDNHSVRRLRPADNATSSASTDPIPLEAAVEQWMRENNCPGMPKACPRPIIVAAAGGASRAAFFMASIVGYFMQEADRHALDRNAVRNRLFAISGVSGGSLGAVMVTAALDARDDSKDHPCVATPFDLWWGEKINNWRDCFEALTSGDFLTAVFFGFAFNDMLPFAVRDRAVVFEQAWEDRYKAVIKPADQSAAKTQCNGLKCPFLGLRPRDKHWIPLLVLNGTSEATGGRIVTTPLAPTYLPDPTETRKPRCPTLEIEQGCTLFTGADRFHDLLRYDAVAAGGPGWFERALLRRYYRGGLIDDVRLSTAGHNSARFPLISPPGAVRNRNHAVVDRIVDGGYFENYGALSAKELALAIHAVHRELAPFVLVISNDPDDLLDPTSDSDDEPAKALRRVERATEEKKARAAVDGSESFTEVVTPLTTVANTRTAHGTLGVDQLNSALREELPDCLLRMVNVRVWPQSQDDSSKEPRAVSMSWWLSSPVQRHLHQQTEYHKNGNDNAGRLQAVWKVLGATSECATPPPARSAPAAAAPG